MALSRRRLLGLAARAGVAAAGAARPATAAMRLLPGDGKRKQKIVVAGGHPGDPEYGCGGTIAQLTQAGHEVVLLYLNDGAWETTTAATRVAEAAQACHLLGAKPLYAGQRNGFAVVDDAHYAGYGRLLAAESPDAVLTHWPLDNHRDHRATAMLCLDAWSRARQRFALFYYEVSDGEDTLGFAPDRFVDIASTEPRKRAACFAHASQTPDGYYALQDEVARFRGLASGCVRAEAFLQQTGSPEALFG